MRPSKYHVAFRLIAEREVRMRVDFSDEMEGLDSAERRFGLVFAPFRRNLYNLGRLAVHRLMETYKWTTLAIEIAGKKGEEGKAQFMLNRSFDAVGADDSDAEYAPLVTRFAPGSVLFIEEREGKRRQELRALDHLHREISGKVKKAMPWIAAAMRSLSAGESLPPNPPEVHVSIGKLGGPDGPRGDYGREEWERFYRRGPSPDELKPMKLPSPYGFTASAIDNWIEELQKYPINEWAREKKPETLRTVISNLMTAIDAVSQEDAMLNNKANLAIKKWKDEERKKRMEEQMQEQERMQEQGEQPEQKRKMGGGLTYIRRSPRVLFDTGTHNGYPECCARAFSRGWNRTDALVQLETEYGLMEDEALELFNTVEHVPCRKCVREMAAKKDGRHPALATLR